jgi:hypothetical protein
MALSGNAARSRDATFFREDSEGTNTDNIENPKTEDHPPNRIYLDSCKRFVTGRQPPIHIIAAEGRRSRPGGGDDGPPVQKKVQNSGACGKCGKKDTAHLQQCETGI